MNHPAQCRPAKAAVLPHDVRTMQLVNRVNREVNVAIRSVSEKVENWTLSPAAGDCEDYALTKRARKAKSAPFLAAMVFAIVVLVNRLFIVHRSRSYSSQASPPTNPLIFFGGKINKAWYNPPE